MNNTKTDEAQSFDEYKAVESTIHIYIDGAKAGNGALTRTAFYEHAHIVGSIDGTFDVAGLDAFEGAVNSIGAAHDLQYRIVSIDISGPAASAKVEFFNWAGFRFTDFFVLYKHQEQWKISAKVYDSHTNN